VLTGLEQKEQEQLWASVSEVSYRKFYAIKQTIDSKVSTRTENPNIDRFFPVRFLLFGFAMQPPTNLATSSTGEETTTDTKQAPIPPLPPVASPAELAERCLSVIQIPVRATKSCTLLELLLAVFPQSMHTELFIADKTQLHADADVVIQGLSPSMNCPVSYLVERFTHPDQFVYVSVINRPFARRQRLKNSLSL
jgi:hypothetical protein